MIREVRGSQLGSSLLAEAGGGDPAAVQPLESQLTGKLTGRTCIRRICSSRLGTPSLLKVIKAPLFTLQMPTLDIWS
jgi:hypothetical protein